MTPRSPAAAGSDDAAAGGAGLRRGFLGIVPPPAVLDAVDALVTRSTSSRYRWTRREQWHVTLQYYGRVRDPDAMVAALRTGLSVQPSVPMQLRGVGAFPTPRKAHVFWIGVDDAGGALAAAFTSVFDATAAWIAKRDRVEFVPHLTLARLHHPTNMSEEVATLEGLAVGPAWLAAEAVLFESETRRSGAVYHERARIPFGG